ncbi:hypothetical protein GALMADRAFT_96414 [Galerina marginata CBS 339.88]|uniref:3-carboxymuconate cyclase n=1 Tax=Galerina marginata (strain CBS 339.88) TaxID=685588 RepID=A0A067TCI2_GALM3|nr:hypothetical protein GALMADRAFT_96414 [Galerina marginata CBS 339.88]
MFYPTAHLLAVLALVSSTSAALSLVSGAAYFITNDLSGNEVVSMNIGPNGKLGSMSSVSAGGRGALGIRLPAPDPLFSQGSVQVHTAARILVTVNAGSNTVSMFNINPTNPSKLSMIGTPTSSEGEFPISVAINSKATMVCVLNGGAVNGINCYTPDAKLGLIAIPNTLRYLGLNVTTPPSGPVATASTIVFSEDDQTLIVAVKGPPAPGFLAAWSIAADGSLSAEAVKSLPATGGGFMFSLTPIPGKNAFLSADPGSGFDIFNFTGLSATSSVVPIKGQITTCWSSYAPKSGNFFLTDLGNSTITEVNIDSNLKGSIVKSYPQAIGSGTIDNAIASIGGNDFLYVLTPGANLVNVLAVNTPGKAVALQAYDFAAAAKVAGVTITQNIAQGMATYVKP